MTYPVTGPYCQAWKTKKLLASCATWQDLCGVAGDYDNALLHIAIYYGEEPDLPYPRIIVNDTSEGGVKSMQRVGLSNWSLTASVHCTFEIEVDQQAIGTESLEDEGNWFTEKIGLIVAEAAIISHSHTLVDGEEPLELQTISPIEGPGRLPAEERQNYMPIEGNYTKPLWLETVEFTMVP